MVPNRPISMPSPCRRHEHVIIIGTCRLSIRKSEAGLEPFLCVMRLEAEMVELATADKGTQRKQIRIRSNLININFLSVALLFAVIPIFVEFESNALIALVAIRIRLVNLRILR